MVESPIFFQSVQPVLNALRTFDFDSFPLYNQILLADSDDNDLPVEFNLKSIDTWHRHDMDEEELAMWEIEMDERYTERNDKVNDKIQQISTGLDDAQKEAFTHAMESRLAIIQGPPGCGKTFLGVKIVEALLEWNMEQPILVSQCTVFFNE